MVFQEEITLNSVEMALGAGGGGPSSIWSELRGTKDSPLSRSFVQKAEQWTWATALFWHKPHVGDR